MQDSYVNIPLCDDDTKSDVVCFLCDTDSALIGSIYMYVCMLVVYIMLRYRMDTMTRMGLSV